jgi:aminoglycoside 2'-N-acetyltransferase I
MDNEKNIKDELFFIIKRINELSEKERKDIIDIGSKAHNKDISDLWNYIIDADKQSKFTSISIMGYDNKYLVSHAIIGERLIFYDNNKNLDNNFSNFIKLRTAYVDAVFTNPIFQNKGYAKILMKKVLEVIYDYNFDLGALETNYIKLYEYIGFERWNGNLYGIDFSNNIIETPEAKGHVMIYKFNKSKFLNINNNLLILKQSSRIW